MANETITYLEGNENQLVHIFYEFYIFLYLLNHDSKECQELHNVLEDARRLHSRVIMDFFSDTKKKSDDIIVTDIVNDGFKSKYLFSNKAYDDIRTMINKTTAHLTEASCKSTVYPDGLEERCKELDVELVKIILEFTKNIEKIIENDLKAKLQDDKVRTLIGNITTFGWQTILKNLKYFIEDNK